VDPTKIKRITRRRRYPEAEEYQRRLIQEQMQQTFDNLVAESQKSMEAVFLENSGNCINGSKCKCSYTFSIQFSVNANSIVIVLIGHTVILNHLSCQEGYFCAMFVQCKEAH
jgi:hypothetical protein